MGSLQECSTHCLTLFTSDHLSSLSGMAPNVPHIRKVYSEWIAQDIKPMVTNLEANTVLWFTYNSRGQAATWQSHSTPVIPIIGLYMNTFQG